MGSTKSAFDLSTCARPNILKLEPYRCARDDYKDDGTNILLDANENAYGSGLDLAAASSLNRYPDPHQNELKQLLCSLRNTHTHTSKTLTPANLFVGVGSDEAIDALLRCFCTPSVDKILTCPPTYGMYTVSAQVNDIAVVKVPLTSDTLTLDVPAIKSALSADKHIKLAYLCSPGNPTGALLKKDDIKAILEHDWNGVVVVDEAYVDFAEDGTSLAEWVTEWPNLVVMQTLSKAFGLASIRLGVAFADPAVARLLNSLKAPYNVSTPTSVLAIQALEPAALEGMRATRAKLVAQRDRLVKELPRIEGVGRFRGGFSANFLLVEMLDRPGGKPSNEVALQAYEGLAEERGVVVRFRGKEQWCEGCLRITVGTEAEVDRFLKELQSTLKNVFAKKAAVPDAEKKEEEANNIVS
ncbi:histidinol-phosphate aminotransferase [Microthyrium microscopicum]|uniref:histidinol-phosphate transaminase n=1 Tax=Microthyrium microscopicum TaxID=703497 RepID=A0A6A6UWR2_9PEZI|nr:histidinol-phosphate aminotransferase [Microthyrium microscopicum]